MTRTILLNLLLLVSTSLFAQVGIGTNNPKAMLDVASPTSGMLIPRYASLALANTESLPTLNATDHKGMMIYVIEESNKGFWFYDGSAFVKVGTPTNTLPIANGGTGATTAGSALDALLPAQNDNASKVLTSDGTNTSWQKPASRTRSILLGVDDFNLTPGGPFSSPTKQWDKKIPTLAFADGSMQGVVILLPIPPDWNGTSPFTLTGFYISPTNAGNISMLVQANFLSLGQVTYPPIMFCTKSISAPASFTRMMQFTTTLCTKTGSYLSKVMEINIIRNAGDDTSDTATGIFNLLAVRIDYQD